MAVTLYLRGREGNDTVWSRRVYKNVRVSECRRANTNITVKGVVPNSEVTVRIRTADFIPVRTGDRLFLGESNEALPPKGSMNIFEVSDNRRISTYLKHWKVVCG